MPGSAKNSTDQVTYPYMLGIHYNPTDFAIKPIEPAGDNFNWQVNTKALNQLKAAGGSIELVSENSEIDVPLNSDRFLVEHQQRAQMGLLIKVPNDFQMVEVLNLVVKLPAQIQYFTIWTEMGEASQLNLRQVIQFDQTKGPVSSLIGGNLANSSQLHVDTIVENVEPMKQVLLGNWQVNQAATINWTSLPKTRGKLLGDLMIDLVGRGSSAYLNTACTGQPQDEIGIQGQVNHRVSNTFSRIKMRGVVYDHAKLNLTSIGQIDHGSSGSDADQESRLMTIGKHSKGTVNPVLVIDENDVRAGHAASVGQFDEDELYYLQSRGLSLEVAQKILIDNFMEPVMKLVQKEP